MKALWIKLFIPALVVAFGVSAVTVQADEHSNASGSHGTTHPAKHETTSPAKTTTGKPNSSSSSAGSAKPGMDSSKQQTTKHDSPVTGKGDHGTPANSGKSTGGMKKDSTSASSKKNNTKIGAGPKKKTTSTGKKSTSSTSTNVPPWEGGNQQAPEGGGYGGNGGTGIPAGGKTDSKKTSSSNGKKDSTPWGDSGQGKTTTGKKGSKNDTPWGDQVGKGGMSTKTSTSSYPSGPHKMDSCPKEMPKYKTGGCYTQEQCVPKWNSCATYNNWTSCPNEWHVKFRDSYCLPTNYCYWQKKYYDATCGCNTYYDSYSSGWYYYEPVVKCYIPVSYCEQYAVERTVSLKECDVCEVEVPACQTVQNYQKLPVKPACQPYNHGCR